MRQKVQLPSHPPTLDLLFHTLVFLFFLFFLVFLVFPNFCLSPGSLSPESLSTETLSPGSRVSASKRDKKRVSLSLSLFDTETFLLGERYSLFLYLRDRHPLSFFERQSLPLFGHGDSLHLVERYPFFLSPKDRDSFSSL